MDAIDRLGQDKLIGGSVKIRQQVYFGIASDACDPDEISAAVGLLPDRVAYRGSKSTDPLRPATNRWHLHASGDGGVDELIAELLDRLEPHIERVSELVASCNAVMAIEVVRFFNDPEGVEENLDPVVTDSGSVEKIARQHQLLGLHLSVDTMRRLVALGCSVDFDEYG